MMMMMITTRILNPILAINPLRTMLLTLFYTSIHCFLFHTNTSNLEEYILTHKFISDHDPHSHTQYIGINHRGPMRRLLELISTHLFPTSSTTRTEYTLLQTRELQKSARNSSPTLDKESPTRPSTHPPTNRPSQTHRIQFHS